MENEVKKPDHQEVEKIDIELKRLQLVNAKLEMEHRTAELQDAREKLDERKMKRETNASRFRSHGQNIQQDKDNRAAQQRICNHKKGGDGAKGVVGGQGQDTQYAIIRHRVANGDIWVRCLRCAKLWKPPVKSAHKTTESYNAAFEKYNEALVFPTRNQMSTGQQFQWGYNDKGQGGPEYFRERMKSVNLD